MCFVLAETVVRLLVAQKNARNSLLNFFPLTQYSKKLMELFAYHNMFVTADASSDLASIVSSITSLPSKTMVKKIKYTQTGSVNARKVKETTTKVNVKDDTVFFRVAMLLAAVPSERSSTDRRRFQMRITLHDARISEGRSEDRAMSYHAVINLVK